MPDKALFRLPHVVLIGLVALLLVAVGCSGAPSQPAQAPKTEPKAAAPAAPAAPTTAPASAPTTAPAAAPAAKASAQPPVGTEAPKAAAPVAQATTAPAAKAAAPAAAPKGTLTIAAAENPESLDPTISLQIYNWTISFSMFDTLVRTGDDGKIQPVLAEKWETVDPKTWKLTLKKGVKFHDGQPFTSKDVKATLDHIVNKDVQSRQASIWALYDRTETPDDSTAIIYTKEPMGTLLTNLTLTTIIPANPSKPLTEFPIGTGPFKFVEWKKDDRLTVEANADYWGGAPKVQRLVFRTIPELSTRVSALERGEVDLVDIVPTEEFSRLEKAGIKLMKQPTTYLRFIWLGVDGPMADVRVRRAINMAIDRQAIIKDLFGGEGFEVDGCVAPGVTGYVKMPAVKYDVEAAKSLMKEAGQEQGFVLELKTAEYLSKQKEMAEVVAGYLSKLNIKTNVVVQDQALWLKDLMALNWQAEQIGTSTLTGDADYTLRRLYHSSAKRVPYKNDKLDQLLIAQTAEVDPAKRLDMFKQACEIIWNDVPTVFLFGTVQTYGVSPKVKNLKTYPSQFMYFKDVAIE